MGDWYTLHTTEISIILIYDGVRLQPKGGPCHKINRLYCKAFADLQPKTLCFFFLVVKPKTKNNTTVQFSELAAIGRSNLIVMLQRVVH